jgi:hypothetical protein
VDWKRRYELPERNVQWRYGVQGEVLVSGCESGTAEVVSIFCFILFITSSILCFDPNHERKHQECHQGMFIRELRSIFF